MCFRRSRVRRLPVWQPSSSSAAPARSAAASAPVSRRSATPRASRAARRGDVRFDWRDPATYPDAVRGVEGIFIVGPGSATDWSRLLRGPARRGGARRRAPRRAALRARRRVPPRRRRRPGRGRHRGRLYPLDDPASDALRPELQRGDVRARAGRISTRRWARRGIRSSAWRDIAGCRGARARRRRLGRRDHRGLGSPRPRLLTRPPRCSAAPAARPSIVAEDRDVHERRLLESGTPAGYVTWRMAMLDGIAAGRDAYLSDGVERVLGRPATGFEQWAQEGGRRPVTAAGRGAAVASAPALAARPG